MEREKPYRCEVCGKRYKNLNGLKYHRAHSPPCNPDLQTGAAGGLSRGLSGLSGGLGGGMSGLSGLNGNGLGGGLNGGLGTVNLQGLQGLNPNANIAGAGLVGMGSNGDSNVFP